MNSVLYIKYEVWLSAKNAASFLSGLNEWNAEYSRTMNSSEMKVTHPHLFGSYLPQIS